jgi:AhpD family alkylhydroperoxidase
MQDQHAPRLDYRRLAPAPLKAYLAFTAAAEAAGIERSLLELIKTRVSQINGCSFCVDMHTRDARAHGETERRLYGLAVWHETPFFTPRERAALTWAEILTRLPPDGVSDELYAATREHFTDEELGVLSFAVVAINGWNRLGVAFRPALPADQ